MKKKKTSTKNSVPHNVTIKNDKSVILETQGGRVIATIIKTTLPNKKRIQTVIIELHNKHPPDSIFRKRMYEIQFTNVDIKRMKQFCIDLLALIEAK